MIRLLLASALFSAPALADPSLLYVFGNNACSGTANAIVPVGTANVNCSALPHGSTYWNYSLKVAGDATCAVIGGATVEDICKSYNGR